MKKFNYKKRRTQKKKYLEKRDSYWIKNFCIDTNYFDLKMHQAYILRDLVPGADCKLEFEIKRVIKKHSKYLRNVILEENARELLAQGEDL